MALDNSIQDREHKKFRDINSSSENAVITSTDLYTGLKSTIDSISAKLASDAVMNGATELTPKFAAIAASTSGNNTIVAAVTGKKIRVLAYKLSFSGTVNGKFQTGAGGTDLTGLIYGVANVIDKGDFSPVGHFETAAGALLNLNLSGAVAVGGYIVYVEV